MADRVAAAADARAHRIAAVSAALRRRGRYRRRPLRLAAMGSRELEALELIREARAAGGGRGRAVRKTADLTQAEVAAAITTRKHPVTRTAVAMWEGGQRKPSGPRALAYGKLLRALEGQSEGRKQDAEREPASR